MDCPSEENLIRMALADASAVAALDFDLKDRVLTVQHGGSTQELLGRLIPLNLGAQVLDSVQSDESTAPDAEGNASEARTLKLLLAINGAMFVFELIVGLIAQSTGLIADSLDMFADAAVYGLALYAVGRAAALKMKAAHIAGWLQVVLALGALLEVVRRAVVGSEPASMLMMSIGLVALIAKPLSKNQVIQHGLAVAASEMVAAKVATRAAFASLEAALQARTTTFDVALAKVRAGQAASRLAAVAHQFHGAIGFTQEHVLHHTTLRLWSWRQEFGGDATWARALGRAAIAQGAAAFWPSMTERSLKPALQG